LHLQPRHAQRFPEKLDVLRDEIQLRTPAAGEPAEGQKIHAGLAERRENPCGLSGLVSHIHRKVRNLSDHIRHGISPFVLWL
jgi:hypothetical protein